MVEGDGAAAEEDEGKCQGGQSQGELVPAVANQSIVEVDFDDGDGKVDANGKRSDASEQAQQDEQPAKEFGEGGEVGCPGGESEAGDKLRVVVKASENLVVSVVEHYRAKGKAHDEERKGLQAIKIAQGVSPKAKIDYSSGTMEGSRERFN